MEMLMNALRRLLASLFGSAAPDAAEPSRLVMPPVEGKGEEVLITGVVRPRSAAGSQFPPAQEWTMSFVFEAWRGADGIIHSTPLVVRRVCSETEMRAARKRINATRIISARVRFVDEKSAQLLELVDARLPADDPLARLATDLAVPVTRQDERFGTLTLDRSVDLWEGKASWTGGAVDVQLSARSEDELTAALEVARALWNDQAGWSERIQAYAVAQLLPLKNDSWLDDDEEPLTPAQFRARMRLESITVEPDGDFIFWHNDGDLFCGHTIQVVGNLQDGPTDADIPG
jgi:hypothetical protein